MPMGGPKGPGGRPRFTPKYQQQPPSSGPISGTPPPINTQPGGPIGVPEGYEAQVPINLPAGPQSGSATPVQTSATRTPYYYDGDEYRPAAWSSEHIFSLQQEMAAAGVLRGPFVRGYWDDNSRAAYTELLGYANGRGMRMRPALNELLALSDSVTAEGGQVQYTVDEYGNVVPVTTGGTGTTPPALVTRQTDPGVLRRVFRQAVIDIAGEGWDQSRIEQLVQSYNQMEIQRQREMYDAEIASQPGLGGEPGAESTVTDIPTPDAWIEAQVAQQDPGAVAQHEALGFTDIFMQTMANPAWGVGGQSTPPGGSGSGRAV
jgi:hypothetical protein